MRILIISTTNYFSPFKVGSYHIYNELKELGHDTYFLNCPISPLLLFSGSYNRIIARLKGITYGLPFVYSINLIPLRFAQKIGLKFLAKPFIVNKKIAKKTYDLIVIDSYEWLPWLRYFKSKKYIYRPTDIYSNAVPDILDIEKTYVRAYNIPVIVCSENSEIFYKKYNFSVILRIANGVSSTIFRSKEEVLYLIEEKRRFKRYKAVYIGSLDDRVDYKWLNWFSSYYKIEVDIYSPPSQNLSYLNLGKNKFINYKGLVKLSEILKVSGKYSIGLLPFNGSPKNQSRSPMKQYEYLALGLTVISSSQNFCKCINTYYLNPHSKQSLSSVISLSHTICSKAIVKDIERNTWSKIVQKILNTVLNG